MHTTVIVPGYQLKHYTKTLLPNIAQTGDAHEPIMAQGTSRFNRVCSQFNPREQPIKAEAQSHLAPGYNTFSSRAQPI